MPQPSIKISEAIYSRFSLSREKPQLWSLPRVAHPVTHKNGDGSYFDLTQSILALMGCFELVHELPMGKPRLSSGLFSSSLSIGPIFASLGGFISTTP